MKKHLIPTLCLSLTLNAWTQSNTLFKLWYDEPAKQWVEALPVGNGRLGAMIFGDPANENIQLNENTVWAGQPSRNDSPAAKETLPEVRRLIFEGKYREAQHLINQTFFNRASMGMPYQTVGNLSLRFGGHEQITDYYRELNIETAVASTQYDVEGVTFKREVFASFPDQVIILNLTATEPGKINFTASMNRPAPVDISTEGPNQLIMTGVTGDCEEIKGAVRFEARVKIRATGGTVSATDTSLIVDGANEATLSISMASNFNNYHDITGDAAKRASAALQTALEKDYQQALTDHVAAYQHYYNRVRIDLGVTDSVNNPTDMRIKQFSQSNDPQLAALYFQFGRYLLISSSQPGGQPANLQGIWTDQLYPPWDSKYTVNINTEMNYWPSESTNLSEMNEPLIQMLHELSETGRETAKVMYGAEGWVLHHNTDIWRINGPVDGAFWGMWPMGGAWLCQHLFNKYEYNGDKAYLKSVYPVMKSAVEFYLGFLIEEPSHHWLVVCPSVSPENAPAAHPGSSISYGTTMDNQLLFDLFTKTIEAAKMLNTDKDFSLQVQHALDKLPPMQIGQYGQLQEWIEDWDNPKDDHRHVSHLYGVFPSNQISPFRTPELFNAARTSLIYRGDPSTGWSMNWKINLWAHFLDGNHAYKLITDQIRFVSPADAGKGGTYANLFDAHPPFQIDGNFGFTSGIAEMLMQSDDGSIFVLPALPDVWQKGHIEGLRARGGFEITSLAWENGEISDLVIKSNLGGNCRIRTYSPLEMDGDTTPHQAKGENSNSFYRVPHIKKPLISSQAKMESVELKSTYLYDMATNPGETTIFHRKQP